MAVGLAAAWWRSRRIESAGHEALRTADRRSALHARRIYDERGNYVELIGRLADLSGAEAALRAAVEKHPGKRIFLRERCRVIKRYDELG
jgi:hypothetical protein